MILFFEQFKKCREKTQKLEPKSCKMFGLDFFGNGKKTKKLQKCNFATLQLFGLIAFYYCFLIKKGKKQQKLQSCKVAFLQLFVFFCQKFLAQKNLDFCGIFFWISEVWIPETLSLFFWGLDPNSFYVRNPIPIFWGGYRSQQFLFHKP